MPMGGICTLPRRGSSGHIPLAHPPKDFENQKLNPIYKSRRLGAQLLPQATEQARIEMVLLRRGGASHVTCHGVPLRRMLLFSSFFFFSFSDYFESTGLDIWTQRAQTRKNQQSTRVLYSEKLFSFPSAFTVKKSFFEKLLFSFTVISRSFYIYIYICMVSFSDVLGIIRYYQISPLCKIITHAEHFQASRENTKFGRIFKFRF